MASTLPLPQRIQLDDIGTIIRVTIEDPPGTPVDVSAASIQEIILTSPSGVKKTKTSVFDGTGVNGKIRYITIAGDMDEVGRWHVRGHVIIPTGDFHSIKGPLYVEDND